MSVFYTVPSMDELRGTLEKTHRIYEPERSVRPAREAFLPQRDELIRDGEPVPLEPQGKPMAVLGARPCDAVAFETLDRVFLADPGPDPYWRARREAALVITTACTGPEPTCFCNWFGGGPFNRQGTDVLAVEKPGDQGGLLLIPVTEKGEEALAGTGLPEGSASDEKLLGEMEKKAEDLMPSDPPDLEKVAKALDGMWEAEIWSRYAERCLGCAICTYLCPVCHCFDILDEDDTRIRIWDSCSFSLYSKEGAGTNPRPHLSDRVKNRVMHKFLYMTKNIDSFGCVGCGTCVSRCPVSIDIREIVEEIPEP